MSTNPGIAENTCVMPRDDKSWWFSASAMSDRYNRGIISDGLTEGVPGPCERGKDEEVGVLGGTDIEDGPAPHGESGDSGSIGGGMLGRECIMCIIGCGCKSF